MEKESEAVIGKGVEFLRGDGKENEAFEAIAEVGDITAPSIAVDTVEVTSHSSPGGFKEYINGLKDGGECSFPLNFTPGKADQITFQQDLLSGVTRNYKIAFRPTQHNTEGKREVLKFRATVTGFELTIPVQDKISATVKLKVSGAPEFAEEDIPSAPAI